MLPCYLPLFKEGAVTARLVAFYPTLSMGWDRSRAMAAAFLAAADYRGAAAADQGRTGGCPYTRSTALPLMLHYSGWHGVVANRQTASRYLGQERDHRGQAVRA